MRPLRRRSRGAYTGRSFGERGGRKFGERKFGERKFRGQRCGERKFGERKLGERYLGEPRKQQRESHREVSSSLCATAARDTAAVATDGRLNTAAVARSMRFALPAWLEHGEHSRDSTHRDAQNRDAQNRDARDRYTLHRDATR